LDRSEWERPGEHAEKGPQQAKKAFKGHLKMNRMCSGTHKHRKRHGIEHHNTPGNTIRFPSMKDSTRKAQLHIGNNNRHEHMDTLPYPEAKRDFLV